jgi:hypothetical protein
LATASAVLAGDGKYQIKLNAADQAAARAVVIRRADLGSSGWEGGAMKPDLAEVSAGLSCPTYHPKLSDLVITGVAETDFRRSGFVYGSVAEVLKTRRMVALDWRRSVVAPRAVACLRRTLSSGAKLVSFRKLPFPQPATYAALFRAVLSVQSQGQTVRVLSDIVFVARGRTEITLSLAGRTSAKSTISAAERRLAGALISRARV